MHLIVNERPEAGASLPHTHAQLYALGFVPAAIARERERFSAYAVRTMGSNLLGDLVQEEVRRRERIVAIDDEAVLMAPWASQRPVPADARAAPRRGRASRTTARPAPRCCTTASRGCGACSAPRPPLNLWVRTAPQGAEHFCWRIDVSRASATGPGSSSARASSCARSRPRRPPRCCKKHDPASWRAAPRR